MKYKYLGVCRNCKGEVIYKKHCDNYAYFDCNNEQSGTIDGKPYIWKCNTRHIVPLENNGGQIQLIK